MAGSSTVHPALGLTRTIHPVGQGAFYSESFCNKETNKPLFTAVYDCGGRNTELNAEISKLSRVDIIFISHFHCDHIKGVQRLIDRFKPSKVVFPHISPCRFLVDFVFNCVKDGSGISSDFMLKLLPMMSNAGSNGVHSNIDGTTFSSVGEWPYTVPSLSPFWEYRAFYKKNDLKEQVLLDELKPILALPENCDKDYLELSIYEGISKRLKGKDLLEAVKEAYAKAFPGGHNSYSMLVLSHQTGSEEMERKIFDCLYTGDVDPDKWVLDIESTFNPNIVQVPHHGSNHSHNDALYKGKPIVFISVGETNRYRHPGLKTFLYLLDTCKEVHVVTEDHNRAYSDSISI